MIVSTARSDCFQPNALCVGTTQDYPETDNLDEGYCYVNSAIPNVSLSEWIGSIGTIYVPAYEMGPNSLGYYQRGLQYGISDYYGPHNGDTVMWWIMNGELTSDAECGPAGAEIQSSSNGMTTCAYNFEKNTGTTPIVYTYNG